MCHSNMRTMWNIVSTFTKWDVWKLHHIISYHIISFLMFCGNVTAVFPACQEYEAPMSLYVNFLKVILLSCNLPLTCPVEFSCKQQKCWHSVSLTKMHFVCLWGLKELLNAFLSTFWKVNFRNSAFFFLLAIYFFLTDNNTNMITRILLLIIYIIIYYLIILFIIYNYCIYLSPF